MLYGLPQWDSLRLLSNRTSVVPFWYLLRYSHILPIFTPWQRFREYTLVTKYTRPYPDGASSRFASSRIFLPFRFAMASRIALNSCWTSGFGGLYGFRGLKSANKSFIRASSSGVKSFAFMILRSAYGSIKFSPVLYLRQLARVEPK